MRCGAVRALEPSWPSSPIRPDARTAAPFPPRIRRPVANSVQGAARRSDATALGAMQASFFCSRASSSNGLPRRIVLALIAQPPCLPGNKTVPARRHVELAHADIAEGADHPPSPAAVMGHRMAKPHCLMHLFPISAPAARVGQLLPLCARFVRDGLITPIEPTSSPPLCHERLPLRHAPSMARPLRSIHARSMRNDASAVGLPPDHPEPNPPISLPPASSHTARFS